MDNLSPSTILDIYEYQKTLNVKINIFKIKPFANYKACIKNISKIIIV